MTIMLFFSLVRAKYVCCSDTTSGQIKWPLLFLHYFFILSHPTTFILEWGVLGFSNLGRWLRPINITSMNFIHRSDIYRDMAVAAFLSGLHRWMFGSLGWSIGPAMLVCWPLQLKTGIAAVFTCKLCLKKKKQRESHITLGYFLVQYYFELHPPFK